MPAKKSTNSNPYKVLGISPNSNAVEIAAAYRNLARIYHPDRHLLDPKPVRDEAERRMKELNEAYAAISKGAMAGDRANGSTGVPKDFRVRQNPWEKIPYDIAVQMRARAAAEAEERRKAMERDAVNGQARLEPKPRTWFPVVLTGLGEALVRNNIRCQRCRAIQWLPDDWRIRMHDSIFRCSECNVVLLAHRVQRGAQPTFRAYGYVGEVPGWLQHQQDHESNS